MFPLAPGAGRTAVPEALNPVLPPFSGGSGGLVVFDGVALEYEFVNIVWCVSVEPVVDVNPAKAVSKSALAPGL